MITIDMLTGRSSDHLVTLGGNHRLQFNTTKAFLAMQQAAAKSGFKLQSASAFRDFSRQLLIWNEKFSGKRPRLDTHTHPLHIATLTEGQLCEAILHWSALPGASRHHWGTEIDIYDPLRIPVGQTLQLEPWEYEEGGYFAELNNWLTDNMASFDFYRPFTAKDAGVAYEPWHISYWPLSHEAEQLLTPDVIRRVLLQEDINGKSWLLDNLDYVFRRYIKVPD
ncbi:MAG: M15 family metallopeptidase [Providencia sp.]